MRCSSTVVTDHGGRCRRPVVRAQGGEETGGARADGDERQRGQAPDLESDSGGTEGSGRRQRAAYLTEGRHRSDGGEGRVRSALRRETDMILGHGGSKHLTDWQGEVNHAIKATGPELQHRRRPRAADEDQRGAPLRARQRHHAPSPARQGCLGLKALRRTPRPGRRPGRDRHYVPVLAAPPIHPLPDLPAATCRSGRQGGAPAREPPPGARRRREEHRRRGWGEYPAEAPAWRSLVRDRHR